MSDYQFSFVIPVYNEEMYIAEALESILAYSGQQFEVIVVDDNSTDSTFVKVDDIRRRYREKVKLFQNPKKGKVSAINYALKQAQSNVFILMGGDDLCVPEVIEERIASLSNNTSPSVSYCKIKTFSNDAKLDGIVIPKHSKKASVSGGAMAFNRAYVELAFPIPESLINEDTWLSCFTRFYRESIEVHEVYKIGLLYRLHENNSKKRGIDFDSQKEADFKRAFAYMLFIEKYYDKLSFGGRIEIVNTIASNCLIYNRSKASIIFMANSGFKSKVKALFQSSVLLHHIKNKFYRILAGR